MGMILEVYSGDSPRKKIAVVPFRLNPQFLEELGEGGGSFTVRSGDERLEYLQVRNYVKVKVENKVVAGFVITGLEPKLVDSGEFAGRNTVVKGKGFLSSASDAVVLPHGGLKSTSPDTRSFNFASPRGSWINLGTWRQPHVIAKRGAKGNPWGTAPAEWPDFPTASWIWGQPYKYIPNEGAPGSPQPPRGPISPDNSGFCYFRRDFTTSVKGKYSFFVAADDIYEVYVNGQLLATAKPGHENWTKTQRVDFELDAGPQVIGVKVHNTSGSGGFIGALAEVGESDQKKKAKLLAVTGATTWRVLPFPASNPGWTPGEIMNQLISEARTRGVRWAKNLKLGYTNTTDSNGEAWNRDVDYTFNVGENYLSVINKLTEASCDVWVDPADFTLHMAKSRGKDRTDPKLGNGVVQLLLGKNLLSATQTIESDIKNTLVVESSTGRLTVKDSKSIAKYGVIEDSLNLTTDSGVARTIASKVLSARSNKTVGATYKVIPFPGAVPTQDFEVGDWILAPGEDGAKTRRRVTSISVTEDKDTGAVLYDVEFDTIFLTRQQHIDRWVTNTQNGSMGGTVLTSNYRPPSISTASSSTSMAGSLQNNVVVDGGSLDTVGYFTAAGAPAASVAFSWDVETEYESDSADHSYVYEVYGVPDTSSPNSVVLHTTTTDTQVTVRDLPVGEDYTLRLVTKNEAGEEVSSTDFEVALPMPDAVGMAAPSKPTVYTSQGTVVVEWDGHMAGGAVKPSQLTHVRAVASPVTGGPYTERGPLISKEGGAATFVGLPQGEERYVALVSVDTVGNESVASEESSLSVRGIDGDRDIELGTIKKELLDNGILSELGDLESATKDRAMLVKNHSFETDGVWEPEPTSGVPDNLGRVEVGEGEAYDGKWVVRASTGDDAAQELGTGVVGTAALGRAPIALSEGGTYALSAKVKFQGVYGSDLSEATALAALTLAEVVSHEPYTERVIAVGTRNGNNQSPDDEWVTIETASVKIPEPITGEYLIKYGLQSVATVPAFTGTAVVMLDSVEVYDRTPVMAVNGNTFSQNPPAGEGAGVGALWYQYAVVGGIPGDIIGMWRWDGAAWESMGLNNQVIANLDAGKIDTGFLNAARILAASITTDKLSATAIDGMTITGALIRTAELGQRMEFDVNGLRALNSSEEVTASISPSSGGLSLTGKLLSQVTASGVTSTSEVGQGQIRASATASSTHAEVIMDYSGLTSEGNISPLWIRNYSTTLNVRDIIISAAYGDVILEAKNSVKIQGDTNWANFTRATGMVGVAQWRRYLGQIYVYIDYTNEVAGGAHVQLGTLPAAARPSRGQALSASGTNGPTVTSYVDTAGVIRFRVAPNTTATAPLVTDNFLQ